MVILEPMSRDQETVIVPFGETFRVILKDISASGYRWEVKGFDEAIIKQKSEHLMPSGAPGASGKRIYDFLGISCGHTHVYFELSRPWEKNSVAIKQVSVDVTVE